MRPTYSITLTPCVELHLCHVEPTCSISLLEMSETVCILLQVPSVDLLLQHISHRLLLLPEIIDFANRHSAKDLRWKAFKREQAALNAVCLSVTNGDPDTIVAYGAASFDHAHHGNRSGPTKKVLRRLKSMARVYLIDEYLTSQLCAGCHHRMRNAALGTLLNT